MSETFEQAIERCLMDGTTAKALRVMADDFDDRLDFIETGAIRQGANGIDALVERVNSLRAELDRASDAAAVLQRKRDEAVEIIRELIATSFHYAGRGDDCFVVQPEKMAALEAFLARYETVK